MHNTLTLQRGVKHYNLKSQYIWFVNLFNVMATLNHNPIPVNLYDDFQ